MTQDAVTVTRIRPGVLRMDFQPIVDTARGTVVGYESLARFAGPPHVPPDRWFAQARAAGVGAELEAHEHIWGPIERKETSYLRVYIAQLRQKLERDPAHPRHLITEAGMGYRFRT